MNITNVFLVAFLISLTSVAGVFFLQKNSRKFLDNNIHYLISFSAGVLLIVSGSLIVESWELLSSAFIIICLVVLGFLLAKFIIVIFPEVHHHHDDCCDNHKHKRRKIIMGDAIHNIADGLVLVGAFFVSPIVGLSLAVSIFIHELLQGISIFFVLVESGYSVKKAIFINFLTSLTILIGVVLGLYLGVSDEVQGVILALLSGFFLNIVFDDLLPHQHREDKKEFSKHLIMLIIGLILMFSLLIFLGH